MNAEHKIDYRIVDYDGLYPLLSWHRAVHYPREYGLYRREHHKLAPIECSTIKRLIQKRRKLRKRAKKPNLPQVTVHEAWGQDYAGTRFRIWRQVTSWTTGRTYRTIDRTPVELEWGSSYGYKYPS